MKNLSVQADIGASSKSHVHFFSAAIPSDFSSGPVQDSTTEANSLQMRRGPLQGLSMHQNAGSLSGDSVLQRQESSDEQSGGLCLQTPWGGGQIKFTGFSRAELQAFRAIPEDGCGNFVTPVPDQWYDADGFWWSGEPHPHRWFKVSNHCEAEIVRLGGNGFRIRSCCNWAAGFIWSDPHWTEDTLWSEEANARCTNPFATSTTTP